MTSLKQKIMDFILNEPLTIVFNHSKGFETALAKFVTSIEHMVNHASEPVNEETAINDVFSPFFDSAFNTPLFIQNDRNHEMLRSIIIFTNKLDKHDLTSNQVKMIMKYSFHPIERKQGTLNHDNEKRLTRFGLTNNMKEISVGYIRSHIIPLSENMVLSRILIRKNQTKDMRSLREISKTRIVSGIRGNRHQTSRLPWNVLHPKGNIAKYLSNNGDTFTKKSNSGKKNRSRRSKSKSKNSK
jgi:hypothetical protein